ncbi:VOC family protein [Alphaproteobacteria bacterium]|jgi:catechol 2,3-dioxygenase-like lactoylglutathione lyase family enzyme|nr:VOC family protein [Alphaproteobacteria bacterium]
MEPVKKLKRNLSALSLVVPDYDDAIEFYVQILGFTLVEDTELSADKRWVIVSPGGSTHLLLAKAQGERQTKAIGNQSGGRVFLILQTDDFYRDYQLYKERGVVFEEEPREEPYGTVAVFVDIFGNRWDLIEPV